MKQPDLKLREDRYIKNMTVSSFKRSHYMMWKMYDGDLYDLSIRFYFTVTGGNNRRTKKQQFHRKFTLKSHRDKTEWILSQHEAMRLIKIFHGEVFEVSSRLNPFTGEYHRLYIKYDGTAETVIESNRPGKKKD